MSKLEESMKLISTHENGKHKAKVYKNSDLGEHQVKFYTDGKHHVDADYHTDDKEDAEGTAKHQINNMKESIDESVVDGRELATQGKIHPRHAQHCEVGQHTDFYSPTTGDKLHGKVVAKDKDSVTFQHKDHGKVKQKISDTLNKPISEEVQSLIGAIKTGAPSEVKEMFVKLAEKHITKAIDAKKRIVAQTLFKKK